MTGIYVIKAGTTHCKVGISTNPESRLKSLQSACPLPLELSLSKGCSKMARQLEKRAHEILSKKRCHGEWFSVSARTAVSAVMKAADELGVELTQPTPPVGYKTISVCMSQELWDTIQDFRFENRYETTNEAVIALIRLALDRHAKEKALNPHHQTADNEKQRSETQ